MAIVRYLATGVDWSPAWPFTDAFKASRPWISQAFNTVTWNTSWDPADAPLLALDANGNPTARSSWQNAAGETMQQRAGTLMFRGLGGGYAGGVYRAEWDGTGTVTFGFDARTIASGTTAAGRHFADLEVTPSDDGISMQIVSTDPADPARSFNVWMPDWQGRRFAGQQWRPGDPFSPFHPLFLERLKPFGTIRFMGMQETNSSDIRAWSDRRDAFDIRQGSGSGGTPSEPIVNGMSVEYMVQLANDLDANPWFNMPHMADDDFVRNFATYVRDHLEPGRKAYVEWSNEVWNFGWGFEASHWVMDQVGLAANEGLDNWQVAGREAKRDLDIWSAVFAGQTDRLVRVAAGWAAVDWVTNRIVESMGGSFDAIAIAPYITPTDEQRAAYTSTTTVDRVIADTRANMATSLEWVGNHERLAQEWQRRLGRPIQLVAYEGGPHLDGRNEPYQNAFYAATNDARMGEISLDYLRGLDAAGMDLYVDFQFTGYAGATPWGDFAKLHRMDEPLTTAHRYRAVVAAADGSLWNPVAPPPPVVGIAGATIVEGQVGRRLMTFVLTLSAPSATPVTVRWNTVNGTATAGRDYVAARGAVTFAPGQTRRTIAVAVIGDRIAEADETFRVNLSSPLNAALSATAGVATGTIRNDDGPVRRAAAFAMLAASAATPVSNQTRLRM
ncbi:MAG: Calx-beta domain-containing protein [Planctomycetia bacterium]